MRRFLIATVAAAAMSGAAAAPAQADHDKVCAPAVPGPVCVTGLQHVVPATQDAAWAAFVQTMQPVVDAYTAGALHFDSIPDPLCNDAVSPVCVHGLRALANTLYFGAAYWIFSPPYAAACYATNRPFCTLPVSPPAP